MSPGGGMGCFGGEPPKSKSAMTLDEAQKLIDEGLTAEQIRGSIGERDRLWHLCQRISDIHSGEVLQGETQGTRLEEDALLLRRKYIETLAELEARRMSTMDPFKERAADALADAVDTMIKRNVLDSRSLAGDALLDYRNPPHSDRSDQIVKLLRENDRLREKVLDLKQLSFNLEDS